ncbi:hypothetical protein FRC07_007690 [Ceratobasidium sp. 392]|nr:hypothetical protein FRC07_007690 [Ceratobasidium sp. 392]
MPGKLICEESPVDNLNALPDRQNVLKALASLGYASKTSFVQIEAQSNRCQGITTKNVQCKNPPQKGSDLNYCYHHVGQARKATQAPVPVTTSGKINQCEAITQKGYQCKRREQVSGQRFCWQHQGQAGKVIQAPMVTASRVNQCEAITLKGHQCKRSEQDPGQKFCWQHIGQASKTVQSPVVLKTSWTNQCEAITKAGHQCTRNERDPGSGFCWQHGEQVTSKVIQAPVVVKVSLRTGQCGAITQAGHQCSRNEQTSGLEFCWQHKGKARVKAEPESLPPVMSVKHEVVDFEEWIPQDLSQATRTALMSKLTSPPSDNEYPGYVYAFEIIDPDTPHEVHFKVGFSNNIARRLGEWRRQCPSKKIIYRACWPPNLGDDSYVRNVSSQLVGAIQPGKPTKYPKLIERLVHIELQDVEANSLHLPPKFRGQSKVRMRARCVDCGRMHKEIFTFKRHPRLEFQGMEFENAVLEVLMRWGAVVSKHFPDTA